MLPQGRYSGYGPLGLGLLSPDIALTISWTRELAYIVLHRSWLSLPCHGSQCPSSIPHPIPDPSALFSAGPGVLAPVTVTKPGIAERQMDGAWLRARAMRSLVRFMEIHEAHVQWGVLGHWQGHCWPHYPGISQQRAHTPQLIWYPGLISDMCILLMMYTHSCRIPDHVYAVHTYSDCYVRVHSV